jgi:outer membrane beta-barrel protein
VKETAWLPLAGAALLSCALVRAASAAEDELDSGRVIAVQNRPYKMIHEFTASAGVLPMDALYKGFSLGGSYTLHLSDLWAWEAVDFHYSSNVSTGVDVTLARRWSVAPTHQPQVQYLAASHLIFSPLFGKFTLFNRAIIAAEAYLAVGGGVAHFDDGFRPELSIGPGVRIFFSQRVSTRLDVRSSLAPNIGGASSIEHILQIMLGVAFNFGSVRATEAATEGEKDVTTGFEALDELYPESNPKKPGAQSLPKASEPDVEEGAE